MGDPETIPAPADAPPDWATTTDDFLCPLCSYNLRGLTTPRCPECGYTFTWSNLASAQQATHPYLFEHHPRRNLWSFLRTLAAGVLPRLFWRTLTAFHAVRPRRLAAYHVLALLLTLLPALISVGAVVYQAQPPPPPGTVWFGRPSSTSPVVAATFALVALYVTWPWAMFLTLMIYRGSMWRASVRTGHLARCVVYAWDVTAWPGLTAAAMLAYVVIANKSIDPLVGRAEDILAFSLMAWFPLVLVAVYRLVIAYQHYLKMRRAWLAIPLAGLAVLLAYLNIFVIIGQIMNSR